MESELDQAGIPPRKARFLLGGMLGTIPLHFLAFYCRPLWRTFCRMGRSKTARAFQKSPEQHHAAIALFDLILAFEARESWEKVQPHLDQITQDPERYRLTAAFALLYFYNGRFAEARSAALYNEASACKWIQETPETARHARQLWCQTSNWYPRGHPSAIPLDVTNPDWRQQNLRRRQKTFALDNGAFKRYRDTRFALLVLDWADERTDILEKLKLTRKEKNPVWPLDSLDVKLARKIGIPDPEIHAMLNEAEELKL